MAAQSLTLVPTIDSAIIEEDAKYFDELLALIPPQLYFPPESQSDFQHKYMKNKQGEAPEQQRKEHSKKAQKQLEKSKTVPELIKERHEEEQKEKIQRQKSEKKYLKKMMKKREKEEKDSDNPPSDTPEEFSNDIIETSQLLSLNADDNNHTEGKNQQNENGPQSSIEPQPMPSEQQKTEKNNDKANGVVVGDNNEDEDISSSSSSDLKFEGNKTYVHDPETKTTSLQPHEKRDISNRLRSVAEREELKKKLIEKINELRRKRKAPELDMNLQPKSNENYEISNRKRRKLSAEKKTPVGSQSDKKKKHKKRNQHNEQPNIRKNETSQSEIQSNQKESNHNNPKNDLVETDIQFGSFEFSENKPLPTYLALKRKHLPPQVLLKKVEANRSKLEQLPEDLREQIKEKQLWAATLKRAEGEKVKDKPELLKKSIKKEKAKKRKSAKKWKERIDAVKREQKEKQKKRAENIQNKIKQKYEKRLRKIKKRRPGFEGPKTKFLNQ
jgi:hypothetical protein